MWSKQIQPEQNARANCARSRNDATLQAKNFPTLPLVTDTEHMVQKNSSSVFFPSFGCGSSHKWCTNRWARTTVWSTYIAVVVSVKRGSMENDSATSVTAGHLVAVLWTTKNIYIKKDYLSTTRGVHVLKNTGLAPLTRTIGSANEITSISFTAADSE